MATKHPTIYPEEYLLNVVYDCPNCGRIITSPDINFKCICGWTGSKYLEPEKRLINKKKPKNGGKNNL